MIKGKPGAKRLLYSTNTYYTDVPRSAKELYGDFRPRAQPVEADKKVVQLLAIEGIDALEEHLLVQFHELLLEDLG